MSDRRPLFPEHLDKLGYGPGFTGIALEVIAAS